MRNLSVEKWQPMQIYCDLALTHWGRVTHICLSKLTIFGSDNGLSPGRHQAVIWTNAWILLMRPLGTKFDEMLIEILKFSFVKMRLKVSSAKWRPFCLRLNVLNGWRKEKRNLFNDERSTCIKCSRLNSPLMSGNLVWVTNPKGVSIGGPPDLICLVLMAAGL